MKRLFLIALLLAIASCAKEPLSEEKTDNGEIKISLLFTHDGCSMYRFRDDGEYRYFTKCGETMSRKCVYNPALKRPVCKMETIK